MNVGDRVVSVEIYINNKVGFGKFHGKIVEISNGVAKVEDDFGFTKYFLLKDLEVE